jgi:hypothetical protein
MKMTTSIDGVYTIRGIHEKLPEGINVSFRQLEEWQKKSRKNDFPEPVRTLGRFRFYNYDEVIEWITLWRRATKLMGNPEGLKNGKR